jgi:8-oxo-dGTP pyrophosphatase MutT (NUDIX family)
MRYCAGSILTDANGRALLLWQPRQKYSLPGGIVEPDETPAQGAVREAKEEIGVAIALEYIVGMYHVFGGGKPAIVTTIYKAHVVSGVLHIADPNEVLRLEWFAPGTVPTSIVNDVRAALPDFWAGARGAMREVERIQDF